MTQTMTYLAFSYPNFSVTIDSEEGLQHTLITRLPRIPIPSFSSIATDAKFDVGQAIAIPLTWTTRNTICNSKKALKNKCFH